MNLFDFIFYNTVKVFVNIFFRTAFRLEIKNSSLIPRKGGVLLVGNHSSWFDTLFLNCAIRRPLWFVTGEFILGVPILSEIVKHLCIIPIRKNSGTEGISATIKKLQEGNVVCIFPEGQLTRDGELQRFRNGVSVIQKETNLPIIPFYIRGAYETWSLGQKKPQFFRKVELILGEPFLPTQEKDSDIANEIREKVKSLSL